MKINRNVQLYLQKLLITFILLKHVSKASNSSSSIFKSTAYRLGTSKIDSSVYCLSDVCLSDSATL